MFTLKVGQNNTTPKTLVQSSASSLFRNSSLEIRPVSYVFFLNSSGNQCGVNGVLPVALMGAQPVAAKRPACGNIEDPVLLGHNITEGQRLFLGRVNLPLQIQNRAARRISFHYRDRSVGISGENLSLHMQILS